MSNLLSGDLWTSESEASLKSESEISVNREIRVRPPVVSSGLPLVQLGDPLNYPI